jgi:hypothetical protein
MQNVRISRIALAAAAAVALAACSKSATPSVVTYANISGDYSGSITSGGSTTSVTGTLAQHGNAAGGNITSATSPAQTASLSLVISTANALSGTIQSYDSTGSLCTFSTTGTYANNGVTASISGSYTAVTNCSGQSGTYALTQLCTDTVTNVYRRPMTVPGAC